MLNVLRCAVAIRTTISLVMVVLLAVLISSCPGGKKKKNALREECARISSTVIVGNECLCMSGYTKISPSGAGSLDFQCQYGQTCYGNARLTNGTCQCNNGRVYNPTNRSSPCGALAGGVGLGLSVQQLQTACSGVGSGRTNSAGVLPADSSSMP